MERTDSSAAMSALISDYGNSDDDTSLTVDNISDEENAVVSVKSKLPSVVSAPDENSNQSGSSSVTADGSKHIKLAKRVTKLVSYGPDDQDEDVVDSDEEEDDEAENQDVAQIVGALDAQDASALSRSVRNKSLDEIEIPPEPPGKCSQAVQDKIMRNFEKMKKGNLDLNLSIQRRKDFRNPSIYEKLIEFCQIDEKGTNFPPDIFDPHMWSKESFYDELDKAQKKEMEKREKERKERTKIEFVTGTKKVSSDTSGAPEEKKRKSKWDALPNPPSITLTASATGTKSTIISAVGNIVKKPPYIQK